MTSIPNINWSAVLAAAPTIGVALRSLSPLTGERGLERRTKRHIELLKSAPDTVDSSALRKLIEFEAGEIAKQNRWRLTRKLEWSTIVAVIFVLGLTAVTVLGLWAWSNSHVSFWAFIAMRSLAWFVGVVGFIFTAVGAGTSGIWKGDSASIQKDALGSEVDEDGLNAAPADDLAAGAGH